MSEKKAHARPTVVGLTGGIGSGKSTVANMFAKLSVPVLDLDMLGHQVTAPGSEGLASLVEKFGEQILDGDELNRPHLAGICFKSEEKTQQLNRIIHPLIWQKTEAWIKQQRASYVVIEASVLIESKGQDRVDAIIAVLAPMQVRKNRVMQRGNMGEGTFEAIVARQCDDDVRMQYADHVIQNNRDIIALNTQVKELHNKLIENAVVDTL